MFRRRLIVTALAVWLGLFIAVLMPLHAYAHRAATHGSCSLGSSVDQITDHSDICSICKALSHLSVVHVEVGPIDLHRSVTVVITEDFPTKPSHGFLSLSPRSPPLS